MNQNVIALGLARIMPAARATGLFSSLATFQQPTGATTDFPAGDLDDEGFPVGTYTDIDGLVDIPCMAPPTNLGDYVAAMEFKGMQDIKAIAPKHVLLNDRYTAVEEGWRNGWRVVIDGVVFDLLGAEPSSQGKMTRLLARRLTQ